MTATGPVASHSHGAPRALLIQPPVYDFALYDLFHQPYGLLRIGAWLQAAGYSVELLDCLDPAPPGRTKPGRGRFTRQVVERPPAVSGIDRQYARYGAPQALVAERIAAARPDVILVTTGMTYWYPGVAEIGRMCGELLPGVPLIAGGIYATLMRDHCASQLGSDLVVAGPAGPALQSILTGLSLPPPPPGVPDYPSIDLRADSSRLCEAAAIRLHEGCAHRCAYCASPLISPRFLPGNPKGLADHVGELRERYEISNFAFYDDALLQRPRDGIVPFLEAILDKFGPRTLKFHLPNAVHVERVTEELATLMHHAGFEEIRFGLESTDPEFHSTMDQKMEPGDVVVATASLLRAGFAGRDITAYVLLGLPGQDYGTVQRTLNDAAELGINVSVAEYSPVPGTPLFSPAEQASGLDLTGEPLLHNNSVYSLLSGQVSAREMEDARSRVRVIRDSRRRDIMK